MHGDIAIILIGTAVICLLVALLWKAFTNQE